MGINILIGRYAKESRQKERHLRWWWKQENQSFQEDTKKLQNRWRYPASKKPYQIRQVAKVCQNSETKENSHAQTQVTTSHQPIHPNHREIPSIQTSQAPQ